MVCGRSGPRLDRASGSRSEVETPNSPEKFRKSQFCDELRRDAAESGERVREFRQKGWFKVIARPCRGFESVRDEPRTLDRMRTWSTTSTSPAPSSVVSRKRRRLASPNDRPRDCWLEGEVPPFREVEWAHQHPAARMPADRGRAIPDIVPSRRATGPCRPGCGPRAARTADRGTDLPGDARTVAA